MATILKIDCYKRGLEDGRACNCYSPPLESDEDVQLYDAGYCRGYAEYVKEVIKYAETD